MINNKRVMARGRVPVVAAALLAGIAVSAPAPASASASAKLAKLTKLAVVATLPDLAALASEIGGERVEVTALAGESVDPHYVDPRPSLILPLNRAGVLIVNGLELEIGWLPPLIVSSRNANIQPGTSGYLDASRFTQPLDVPTTRPDRSMGDVHPGGNPHFTFDPRQSARIARAIGELLADRDDPAHAHEHRARARVLADQLDAAAAAQQQRFAALPPERRKIVTYHGSLAYLADWLGLEVIAQIEPRPGVPPHPAHIASVLARMRAESVRMIVQEEHQPRGTSATLSQLAPARVLLVPAATRRSAGETYLDHITGVAEEIYHALAQ